MRVHDSQGIQLPIRRIDEDLPKSIHSNQNPNDKTPIVPVAVDEMSSMKWSMSWRYVANSFVRSNIFFHLLYGSTDDGMATFLTVQLPTADCRRNGGKLNIAVLCHTIKQIDSSGPSIGR